MSAEVAFKCAMCGGDLEVKEYADVCPLEWALRDIWITPCSRCILAAEEAERRDAYDEGFEAGLETGRAEVPR